MWLRDQLPDDFPNFRVMIYGYDTSMTDSDSHQTLDDLARTFVQHLKLVGRAEYSAKPCVIFAHSLGGILVKRALYYMARSADQDDFVLQKIKMTVFFGVPNRGMQVTHLLSMVKGQPNEGLVNTLSVDSPYLNILDEGFAGIAAYRSMRIVSAYETKRTATTVVRTTHSPGRGID
jgi:triacylglycerol esterase/lipase EstA (alpha/beta hydrolase family)